MRKHVLPLFLITACPGGDAGDGSTATTLAATTTGTSTSTTATTGVQPTTGAAASTTDEPGTDTGAAATTSTTSTSVGDPSTGAGPTSGTTDDSSTGDSGMSKVHYVGRYDDSDPTRVKLGWPGTGFMLYMYGTELQVELEETGSNYYQVIIDGQYINEPIATSPGVQLYPVAKNLLLGHHQIEMYRRTGGSNGVTTVTDFVVMGEIQELLLPFEHRVEIIGDGVSIGSDDDDKNLCGDPLAENSYRSYGGDLASGLSYDVHTIAWKGKGVVTNADGSKIETLPQLFDRTLATDAGNLWDYSRWQAEIVVVNLGLADFDGIGDPVEQVFVSGYVDFLAHIREVYPDAFILVLMPWKFDDESAMVSEYLQSVVDQRHLAGDMAVAFEDINVKQLGDGCPGYPYRDTHQAMSLKLADAMFKYVPW